MRTLIETELVKLKSSAKFVIQHAENGFTANIPLDVALAEVIFLPRITTAIR